MPTTAVAHEVSPCPTLTPYQLRFRPAAHLRTMRWLVAAGAACLLYLLWWVVMVVRPGYAPLYWLLLLSLAYKVLWMVHEWVHYVQVREPVPPPYTARPRTVDMLTTACPGEPRAMIIRTITAMQAVRYPHTSYLCDEGDDPALRAACARLGVVHVTRTLKVDAKAGNINHALRQATGELCVVLDPDHVPTPDFLDHVLPYFEDEGVGFVQVVQAYGNQQENLVARGAAEQTYHFYGPLMMGMNAYGTVQAIGANCTFRRAALDSIGGHAAGLTEDMHTAMRLHAAGWQSAYVPQVVSRGLVPASLAAFYAQQLKWSRGAFDLLFRVYPGLCGRFSWAQRLHYFFLPLYFLSGVITLIDLILPVLGLGLSQFPVILRLGDLAQHTLPLVGASLLIRCHVQRWLREPGEGGMHWAGNFLQIGAWWVYSLGFVYAVLNVRVPYLPTPKEGRWRNEWLLAAPNLLLIGLLLGACAYGHLVANNFYTLLLTGMALFNVALLLGAVAMGLHQAVRHVVQDLARRPVRWLVLGLHRLLAGLGRALVPRLRQYGPGMALVGLLATGALYYLRTDRQARQPAEWLLTGAQSVHLGRVVSRPDDRLASTAAGWQWLPTPIDPAYTIAALPIGPTEPLSPLVELLASAHQVPLLSWSASGADTWQPHYWQRLARQVARLPGPVLLRPRLTAATAPAARRAWQHMVRVFEKEHVTNAVWVWTPDAADSLLQRFPGPAYTGWIACPLHPQGSAPGYPALRAQLTTNLPLHQLPVLLLAPAPTGSPEQASATLTLAYPETRAIVFATPSQPALPTASVGAGLVARQALLAIPTVGR